MSKLFFPKDFKTQKIFLVFLWKGKSARKIPACRKQFWKISNMLWRNQMRCKENLKRWKRKYEINTNLPLARARRFKSDVHDFSPPFLPLVVSPWRTGWGQTLNLPPHLLCFLLSSRCGGSVFWLGLWCTPECLPFTVLLDHEALLFLLLKPKKHVLLSDAEMDFSLSDIDPCLGGP